jgi:hypothetical protein
MISKIRTSFIAFLILVAISIFLLGCSKSPSPATATIRSITPEPKKTSTSTFTFLHQISTYTPSPTRTRRPTLTATKNPNSYMCETKKDQGNFGTDIRREFGEAPDKTWLFIICFLGDDEMPHHYVLYNQADPQKTFSLEYPEILDHRDTWYAWGWTMDSQYLFLGYHEFCEYVGTCQFIDVKGLFRLNPSTHEFTPILPFREDKRQYAISISNSAEVLAYAISGTNVLHLNNLSKNIDREITLAPNQFSYGDFVWSPDDTLLLFSSSSKENVFENSFWLYKSKNSSITRLLANYDDKEFLIAGWIDNNTIILYGSGVGSKQPFRYTYNIQTEELLMFEELTPSPTP